MRVEEPVVELSEPQRRVADADVACPVLVAGPPGSGKTTALAARAARLARDGYVAAICSHDASRDAFRTALISYGSERVQADTLEVHIARWMRADFSASGASPDLRVGTDADSYAMLRAAAGDALDMSWPRFSEADFSLDLPLLARPDAFLDEASALFRQLRRASTTPGEFEVGCERGIAEFYGAGIERARALCADPEVRARASKRGREALAASIDALYVQRRAEQNLAELLAHLYRAYLERSRGARVLCPEDAIDEGLAWLARDRRAASRLAKSLRTLIIDDAEDAQPGAARLIDLLMAAGLESVALGGCKDAAIDGLGGRRSALVEECASRIDLPPRALPSDGVAALRFRDEGEEADFIASAIGQHVATGYSPKDVIVLARDEAGAAVYARLLAQRGVPITAPPDAWESPRDIEDILALAAITADPTDHAHLLRVIASPIVGLNDASLRILCLDPAGSAQLRLDIGAADAPGAGTRGATTTVLSDNVISGKADRLLPDAARVSVERFRTRWASWRAACADRAPAASLAYIIDAAGFRVAWQSRPAHVRERLADDAQRLVAAAARVAGVNPDVSLAAVVRSLEAGEGREEPAGDASGAVACRTIVGAKGQRRANVIVAGVAHERFPRIYVSRALAFSKKYGLVVRENVAGPTAQTAKFAWYYAKFSAKTLYLEEEQRALAYGVSRAERTATITGYGKPPRWAQQNDLLAAYGA